MEKRPRREFSRWGVRHQSDADGLWLKYTFIAVAIPALKG
ncbi:hypothetical protein SEENIN0B_03274 [Salmonella enterica subsp. enterica serovar Infantis str. SARB27]|uniref:Uncharacterized protein n=1 Tax=Salmonella enterica subsp. enterica serovar Infantis str. SARB27 TaxID=596155 RepID=A0A6C8GBH0_SALIN|nr:hypothetical protein SEENIN0B_03274 [Salmonella enterica subsp. enterica serovar Infantis str. SARB27]